MLNDKDMCWLFKFTMNTQRSQPISHYFNISEYNPKDLLIEDFLYTREPSWLIKPITNADQCAILYTISYLVMVDLIYNELPRDKIIATVKHWLSHPDMSFVNKDVALNARIRLHIFKEDVVFTDILSNDMDIIAPIPRSDYTACLKKMSVQRRVNMAFELAKIYRFKKDDVSSYLSNTLINATKNVEEWVMFKEKFQLGSLLSFCKELEFNDDVLLSFSMAEHNVLAKHAHKLSDTILLNLIENVSSDGIHNVGTFCYIKEGLKRRLFVPAEMVVEYNRLVLLMESLNVTYADYFANVTMTVEEVDLCL